MVLPALGTIQWFWRVRAADNDGNLSGWSKTGSFTISNSPNTPAAQFVTTDSFDITGAGSTTGHVFLSSAAPGGDAVVQLSTDTPSLVSIPSSVTVPAGATSADFTVSFAAVWEQIMVSLLASYNQVPSWGVNLHPDAAHVTPNNVNYSPAAVTGGNPTTGTVTLTGPAPSGGATVTLSSSATTVATAPASVTVAAGQTSAPFTVSTQNVASNTTVTISAAFGGVSQTATLKVTKH